MRTSIYGICRIDPREAEWLKAGAEIPHDPELDVDLCHLQYGYSPKHQIQLEKKEDMKARGLASPDLGDCLAMSFAVTVERQCELSPDPEIARMEALLSDGEWHWC